MTWKTLMRRLSFHFNAKIWELIAPIFLCKKLKKTIDINDGCVIVPLKVKLTLELSKEVETMTKEVREIIDTEYKGHERIFNGNNENWKRFSECTLKGFVKGMYLAGKITKSEYDNELDAIANMY